MGIEPTSRMVNIRLNDFEDRGHHQVCKHFRTQMDSLGPVQPRFFVDPFLEIAQQASDYIPTVR